MGRWVGEWVFIGHRAHRGDKIPVFFVICVANRYHSFCKWLICFDIACSKKDASRDAPATMGCLLWVGMSIPAHPHAIGRLAGILGIGHGEGMARTGI